MSSAHDLPSPVSAEIEPGPPHLSLVPAPGEVLPAFDLELALAEATPRLQRYAVRRLGSSHEAEEVVQEALLRAYQHRAAFATVDDLMAWSTVVTGRLVIDRARVRGRSVTVADVPEQARTGRDTADVVVARDEARLALDALEAMPTRQAAVLWAREVEGQSYDEIAERYGLTEPTVRSLLHRARKTLRREYASRGGTLPAGGLVLLAPWLQSLTGLGKLRDAVKRAALSGATLSLAGLSAIAAIGLAPNDVGGPSENFAQSQPAPVVEMPLIKRAVVSTATGPVGIKSAPAVGPQLRQRSAAGNPATCLSHNVSGDGSGLGLCGGTRGSTTPVLYIGPELPDNPTGLHRLGIAGNDLPCKELPSTPVSECRDEPTPQPERP